MMPPAPSSSSARSAAAAAQKAVAARCLYAVAAFLVAAVLPLSMIFANKAAAAIIPSAAGAALLAAILEKGLRKALQAVGRRAHGGLFVLSTAFVLWGLLSILWSPARGASLFEFAGTLITAAAAVTLLGILERRIPDWTLPLLIVASIATMATIWLEMLFDLPINRLLGTYHGPADLNRPTITLLLLFWPAFGLLRRARRDGAAFGFAVLMGVTVALSHSGTALVAMIFSMAIYAGTLVAPRMVLGALCIATLGTLAIAPWTGDIIKSVTPAAFYRNLHNIPGHGFSATERVGIWQVFGAVARQRPMGFGFGSSRWLRSNPTVAKIVAPVGADLRFMLHPHNAALQIWVELGIVGALLAGGITFSAFRLFRTSGDPLVAPRLALLAAIIFIGEVSHGAWQAWWVAAVGAAFLVFGFRVPEAGAEVAHRTPASGGKPGEPAREKNRGVSAVL